MCMSHLQENPNLYNDLMLPPQHKMDINVPACWHWCLLSKATFPAEHEREGLFQAKPTVKHVAGVPDLLLLRSPL